MADENKKQEKFNSGGLVDKNIKTKITGSGHTGGYRMNAKAILEENIKRVKEELNSLEILSCRIPWHELTSKEEESLWSYFIRKR